MILSIFVLLICHLHDVLSLMKCLFNPFPIFYWDICLLFIKFGSSKIYCGYKSLITEMVCEYRASTSVDSEVN